MPDISGPEFEQFVCSRPPARADKTPVPHGYSSR